MTTTALPLVVGGNVFGWTADEATSHAVLDAFLESGGSLVDTADGYSAWVAGNSGGESETIIGSWFAASGRRDEVALATKVSAHPQFRGLAAANVAAAARASLQRLQTDRIDLYYAHFDDESVPLVETAAAFSTLVDEGLVRTIGVSNYTPARVGEWFALAEQEGLHRPVALQPRYNLVERGYEETYRPLVERLGVEVYPYSALASGFLTGKYRDGAAVDSARAAGASRYLDARGRAVLAALDEVAAAHDASVTTVALAWLSSPPSPRRSRAPAPSTSSRRSSPPRP